MGLKHWDKETEEKDIIIRKGISVADDFIVLNDDDNTLAADLEVSNNAKIKAYVAATPATPAAHAATHTNGTDDIQTASGTQKGLLSAANWTTFNSKEPAITTLAISKGGTNSGTALSNNRVIQSSGGAIVEAAAITAAKALKSDANGIPTHFDTTTEPSLTELSYVKGVTSAIQTQLNTKAENLFTCSNTDATHTGDTNNTVLKTLLVPTLSLNSKTDIFVEAGRIGATGNITVRLYYNATADLAGSPTQIGTATLVGTNLYYPFERFIVNKNSLTSNYMVATNVAAGIWNSSATIRSTINADLSGQYLVISVQLANATDTARIDNFSITVYKPQGE